MAASAFTVLNSAKKKLVDGTIDLDTHTFKAALLTQAVTLSAASTVDTYAEISSQVTGTGYTAGGATLSGVTLNESSGTVTFDANDVSWASSTITAKYVVIYDDTATNKDILGFVDLNTDSGSATVSSSNGTFTVQWNASGIFAIA
mgnify:CR=1 FL=1